MAENIEFSNVLRESIQDGLKNVLGEGCMQAILFHLKLAQFEQDPNEFHSKLYFIFKGGAICLEKVIVKELFQRLGVTYEEREEGGAFDFGNCVNVAKGICARLKGG